MLAYIETAPVEIAAVTSPARFQGRERLVRGWVRRTNSAFVIAKGGQT